ncbi:MAG: S8 family serine peptidase [Bdellovibrionaceae bacterium]|nr:S8 family serine peptidase [Pseudobdellovibrionaceae bacterium]MBX3033269.1 S8 family serine peptidase [Pseudobdellovibrionaceae bacterium]
MKLKSWIFVVVAMVTLSVAFNNCAKSGMKAMDGFELSSASIGDPLGDPNCKLSPQKARAAKAAQKVVNALSSGTLSQASELLLVIDNNCYNASGGKSWVTRTLKERSLVTSRALTTTTSLVLDQDMPAAELMDAAGNDECILRIDRDLPLQLHALPNDPYYADKQPYLKTIKHNLIVEKLYNAANGINQTIKVAVIDTGIDPNHPDLKNLISRDSQGQIIGLNGMDNSRDVIDSGFHGTHVTGLIAAIANNGIGMSGVMGQNVIIMPVKVSADGQSIKTSAVVNGIRWAADNGAQVINMSLGGPSDMPAMKEAIAYAIDKGVFIAAASGNDGKVLGSQINGYPAMYGVDFEGMISVGSFDAGTGAVSDFSNVSPTYVDLLAPGSNGTTGIVSTVPTNLSTTGYANAIVSDGKQAPIHGTSMASPVAAGAAAMIIGMARSRGYDALPAQVEQMIMKGSPTNSSLNTKANGGRKLDLQTLTAAVDSDTQLDLASATSRTQAKGNVTISQQPQGQKVTAGASFKLSVAKNAASSILVNYQWYKDGVKIGGANQPTLTVANASSAHVGTYKVELTAGLTKVTSANAVITMDGTVIPDPGTGGGCP